MMMDLRHRILAEWHNKQNLSDEETAETVDDETDSEYFNPSEDNIFIRRNHTNICQCFELKWPNTS